MAKPAAITRDEVEHVAALAALALSPDELDRLGRDLGSILAYVAELDELDTAGIAPLTHVSELFPHTGEPSASRGTLRSDEPRPSLARDLVMRGAPATDGTFFKVPKVIER